MLNSPKGVPLMKKQKNLITPKNKFLGYVIAFFALLIYIATFIKLNP